MHRAQILLPHTNCTVRRSGLFYAAIEFTRIVAYLLAEPAEIYHVHFDSFFLISDEIRHYVLFCRIALSDDEIAKETSF